MRGLGVVGRRLSCVLKEWQALLEPPKMEDSVAAMAQI